MIDWLNGKGSALWRLIIAIAMAISLSVGSWIFAQVVAFPEKYPKKVDIIQRLDKFEKNLNDRMCDLEKSNNDLRLFLLRYFSSDDKGIHSETEEPKN